MKWTIPLLAFGLFACTPGGTYQGKLVDGMTGAPRAGIVVLAKSSSSDLTCQVRETTVAEDGTFTLDNLCASDTYTLSVTDETLYVPELGEVAGTEQSTAPVELKAWRAPTSPGLYRLEGDDMKRIKTFSDVESLQTADGSTTVRYPSSKPVKLAGSQKITPGATLVMSGAKLIEEMQFFPLVADPSKRGFAEGTTIEDHVFIGVKFTSDTEFEQLSATPDPAKVTKAGKPERMLAYVASDAIPAGRYAVLAPTDKVTYILDFGAEAPEPAAAEGGEGG